MVRLSVTACALMLMLAALFGGITALGRSVDRADACIVAEYTSASGKRPGGQILFDAVTGRYVTWYRPPTRIVTEPRVLGADGISGIFARYPMDRAFDPTLRPAYFFKDSQARETPLPEIAFGAWRGGDYAAQGHFFAFAWVVNEQDKVSPSQLALMDAETGQSRSYTIPGLVGQSVPPQISPDGQYVAVVVGSGTEAHLWVLEITSGHAVLQPFPVETALFRDSSMRIWAPRGHQILVVTTGPRGSSAILTGAPDQPALRQILLGSGDEVVSEVSWAPGGEVLAVDHGKPAGMHTIDLLWLDGNIQRAAASRGELPSVGRVVPDLIWSSDSRTLFYAAPRNAAQSSAPDFGHFDLMAYHLGTAKHVEAVEDASGLNFLLQRDAIAVVQYRSDGLYNVLALRPDDPRPVPLTQRAQEIKSLFQAAQDVIGTVTVEPDGTWLHLLRFSDGHMLHYGPVNGFNFGIWLARYDKRMIFEQDNPTRDPANRAARVGVVSFADLTVSTPVPGILQFFQDGYPRTLFVAADYERRILTLYDSRIEVLGHFPVASPGLPGSASPDQRHLVYVIPGKVEGDVHFRLTTVDGLDIDLFGEPARAANLTWSADSRLVISYRVSTAAEQAITVAVQDSETGALFWRFTMQDTAPGRFSVTGCAS